MALAAGMALLSSTTALATGTLIPAAFGMTAFITTFAVNFALGVALNALTPKPSTSGASRGYQVNSRGSALSHQIIYGEVRVGGAIVYDEATGTNNKYLHRIIAVSGHEINSFEDIYINDEIATIDGSGNVTSPSQYAGKIRINTHLGSSDQLADADLVAESAKWTSAHRLRGIAYMYIRMEFDADAFPNGVPTFTATVKGKKVYNPATATTAWSDNPALCLRDYLTSSYGLSEDVGNIDDDLVNTAASICNETNTDAGTTRYTTNGAFTTDLTPYDVINNLLTSMGGTLWYAQGKWRMKPAYWTAPVLDLNEDDLRSSIDVATRHSRRDNFNVVKGTFRGEESNWQTTDYPQVDSAAFLAADNGQESVADVDLPFTDNSIEARRIALIALERNRQQLTVTASFGLKTMQVQVGDNIRLTNTRFGWTNKEFEVLSWNFGLTDGLDLQVNMTLRETAESVFDEVDDGVVYERDNTNLPNPFDGLAIANLAVNGGGKTQSDGTFVSSAILTWDAVDNAFISHYEVEWKPTADSNYSSTTTVGNSIELSPIIDAVEYIFRVRAITLLGNGGSISSITYTVGGDVTAPALPTVITATGGFQYITVRWTPPADKDFNYVEVWENTSNTTVGATKVGISSGNEFVRTNLGVDETKWYFLKSVDYSGNVSGFTSGASGTTTFLDDPDFANGIYSLFTDQGLYAIRDVTSLPPSGAFTGEKVFNRTDGKLYQWSGTSWDGIGASSFAELDGLLQTNQVALDAITNDLLANDAVQAENIANLAVTSTKIADDAITTPKIFAGAVTATEIGAGAIIAGKIAANAVTAGTIAANAVTANTVAANAITANNIVGGTITGDKISANTITGGLIAASGIITSSAQINDALITNAKISNLAVSTAKIQDAAISNAKIGNASVTTLKIGQDQVTIPFFYENFTQYGQGAETILSYFFTLPFGGKVIGQWQGRTGSTNDCSWTMYLNGALIGQNVAGGAFQDAPIVIGGGNAVAGSNNLQMYFSGGGFTLNQKLVILGAQR